MCIPLTKAVNAHPDKAYVLSELSMHITTRLQVWCNMQTHRPSREPLSEPPVGLAEKADAEYCAHR